MSIGTLICGILLILSPGVLIVVLLERNRRKRRQAEELRPAEEQRLASLPPQERQQAEERIFHAKQRKYLLYEIIALVVLILLSYRYVISVASGPQNFSVDQLGTLTDPLGGFSTYYRISGDVLTNTDVVVEQTSTRKGKTTTTYTFYLLRQADSYLVVQTGQNIFIPTLQQPVTGWLRPISDEHRSLLSDVLTSKEVVLPYELDVHPEAANLFFVLLFWGVFLSVMGLTGYAFTHSKADFQALMSNLTGRLEGILFFTRSRK